MFYKQEKAFQTLLKRHLSISDTLSNLRQSLCFVGGLFLWGIEIV